jgi:IS4 transposase
VIGRGLRWEKNCIEALIGLVKQKRYEQRSKKRKQDFTRKRKMTFNELIYFMLSMVKESTQNALERVFPQLKKENLYMSRQAFSAARQKIKWEAFQELFQTSVYGSYQEDWDTWRGYRVMAIDGSFLRLPCDRELVEYYGGLGHEQTAATALASLVYDLQNNIVVDARIAAVSENERALAEEHLRALQGMADYNRGHRELIIFDRGYPSGEFVNSLSDKEIAYVIRVPKGFIREQELKGAREGRVSLRKTGRRVRAIRIALSSGEQEILITNLKKAEMEYEAFGELYHKRWGIETKYKELKQKLETENFSGRLVDNVKQDFYAMMTVANMVASCVREANRGAKKEREGRGNLYEYQVNVNHAIGVFKDRLIRVIIEEDRIARHYLMRDLVRQMERRVVPIRPKREVLRKDCHRKGKFHHNHKSNC